MKPANTNPYGADWQSMDICCLDVSLHNRYQEGHYLASSYNWINSRFSECLINLGDSLHRHNLRHLYPNMGQAHEAARALGNKWLKNNERCLKALKISYKILRSDDWLADIDLNSTHEALWSFYYENEGFQNVVKEDIESFVNRKTDMPASIVREASLSYLLEEMAGDILLGKRGGVAHLYPGSRHKSYNYIVKNYKEIPQIIQGMEKSAFKRLSPAKMSLKPSRLTHLNITNEKQAHAA